MLLSTALYDLRQGASKEEHIDNVRSVSSALKGFYAERGQKYLGLYESEKRMRQPETPQAIDLPSTFAEICLLEGSSVRDAALREVEVPCSHEARAAHNCRLTLIDPARSVKLWLEPFGLGHYSSVPMDWTKHLVQMTLRYMPPEQTLQQLTEFDHRIVKLYTEHMAQAKWYHIGVFHAFGLPEYMYVDSLDLVDAKDSTEAMENDARVDTPPDVQAIYDECNLYLDRKREGYRLWLKHVG